MVKHNNVIPNVHFRKAWERHVYTWFDQAPQKKARRLKRQKKAARVFPRPVEGLLRPIVRAPSVKYNTKLRQGYGFTRAELKAAGINRREARGIGISVDHRRVNKSNSSFEPNVERLKQYMAKLVIFPKKIRKSKLRDMARRAKETGAPKPTQPVMPDVPQLKGPILPIKKAQPKVEWRVIHPYERKGIGAHATLRHARSEARSVGKIKKRKEAAAADAAFKK